MYILDDPLKLYTQTSDNIWVKLPTPVFTRLHDDVVEWLEEHDPEWYYGIDDDGRIFIQFVNEDAILLFKLSW